MQPVTSDTDYKGAFEAGLRRQRRHKAMFVAMLSFIVLTLIILALWMYLLHIDGDGVGYVPRLPRQASQQTACIVFVSASSMQHGQAGA